MGRGGRSGIRVEGGRSGMEGREVRDRGGKGQGQRRSGGGKGQRVEGQGWRGRGGGKGQRVEGQGWRGRGGRLETEGGRSEAAVGEGSRRRGFFSEEKGQEFGQEGPHSKPVSPLKNVMARSTHAAAIRILTRRSSNCFRTSFQNGAPSSGASSFLPWIVRDCIGAARGPRGVRWTP